MKTMPATEVRAVWSDLVSRIAFGGERIGITRNGKLVAAIVPAADLEILTAAKRPRNRKAG